MSITRMDCSWSMLRGIGLAVLLFSVIANLGCGGAIANSGEERDPLHLGVEPGPLGTTSAQVIEFRLGSEPSDRIVSLSLDVNSLKATNSGNQDLELLTSAVTIELTRHAVVSQAIVVRDIYQDTYSALQFPNMAGNIVFYDSNGQLITQAISVPAQGVSLSPALVLGADPEVLSVSIDLKNTFTLGASSVTVNPLVVTASSAVPSLPVAPAVGQPESGHIEFLVGVVTSVDTTNHIVTLQPTDANVLQLSYDDLGGTQFVNCDPNSLTGMIAQIEAATQPSGTVLATQISQIGNSATSSELYGVLAGYAPDGMNYNLLVAGGAGVNVTTGLIGNNVTLDWLAASYSVNTSHLGLDLMANPDLVFDETHAFPGQAVQVYLDTLIVPDPDSSNAGLMQPFMFELQEQTLTGQVSNYVYNPVTQTGTFSLTVANDSMIMRMNGGLVSITVRRLPQTFLRNNPTFGTGDLVKVRGLLFAEDQYSNVNYQPPASPVAFILVADRISR